MISVLTTLGMVVVMLVGSNLSAGAVKNTCRATNLTQGTQTRSNLQAAIDAAHPGDRIAIKHVCVGSFKIGKNLTLVGHPTPDGAKPVLNGKGSSGRVLRVARARVTLKNLKVTGGVDTTWDPSTGEFGGGIRVRRGSTLTLNHSIVSGNRTRDEGGGIANYGRLTLNGASAVVGNRAVDGHGGGIANHGIVIMNGSSSVRGNTASPSGGGIANYGTVVMNGSSAVRGNSAHDGGGISLDSFRERHDRPTVTMNDSSSVVGNDAANDGGGIWIPLPVGRATLKDSSSVSGNTAMNAGGGIWSLGTVTVKHSSSVRGNTADLGGGVVNDLWATLTLKDSSSVSGNTATTGGGIWNLGSITLKDSSRVDDNTATTSGGVHNHLDSTIDGTINACDGTSVDQWVGTVEPNTPNDFLDSDVPLIPSGTGNCS